MEFAELPTIFVECLKLTSELNSFDTKCEAEKEKTIRFQQQELANAETSYGTKQTELASAFETKRNQLKNEHETKQNELATTINNLSNNITNKRNDWAKANEDAEFKQGLEMTLKRYRERNNQAKIDETLRELEELKDVEVKAKTIHDELESMIKQLEDAEEAKRNEEQQFLANDKALLAAYEQDKRNEEQAYNNKVASMKSAYEIAAKDVEDQNKRRKELLINRQKQFAGKLGEWCLTHGLMIKEAMELNAKLNNADKQ